MNFKITFLALALCAHMCKANLNKQTEAASTLKEITVTPYNKETDKQKLRPVVTAWMSRNGKCANEDELKYCVDYELNNRIGQSPDPNVVIETYLVSQGQTICGLIATEDQQAEIIYFDSMTNAKGVCPIVAKIIETFKQDSNITKISWADFNGIDTEKKQKDIAALTQHGFSKRNPITIPYSSITLDSYELNLEK